MRSCGPKLNVDVLRLAVAERFNVAVPSVDPPSKKVTVPVGVPGSGDETFAVRVTDWPNTEGFGPESNDVVVGDFADRIPSTATLRDGESEEV